MKRIIINLIKHRKYLLISVFIGVILFGIITFGCIGMYKLMFNKKPQIESQYTNDDTEDNYIDEHEIISEIIYDIYENTVVEKTFDDIDLVRDIVNELGENGYVAIDSKNQINMTMPEKVMDFCYVKEDNEEAYMTIINIEYTGDFTIYDFKSYDGNVEVTKNRYKYDDYNITNTSCESYIADYWEYTDEGYLLFSGIDTSYDQYVLTLDEHKEHVAFRVEPLDEECRELNRTFILPIGYEKNNVFIVDWDIEDYGKLDFYDLYDIFYFLKNGQNNPYTYDNNLGVGAVYEIPKYEFENVIMSYIDIDDATLQSKTNYDIGKETYIYRPRGFYEAEYPEYPYPEVVDYVYNDDGTITLTVNAIFPLMDTAKAYTHQVVVRQLEDGCIEYISNHILYADENCDGIWYTPRLTDEEWEDIYGNALYEEEYYCLINDEEQEQLKSEALSAAEYASGIYNNMDDDIYYSSGFVGLSYDDRQEIVDLIGNEGYVCVSDDCDMENSDCNILILTDIFMRYKIL